MKSLLTGLSIVVASFAFAAHTLTPVLVVATEGAATVPAVTGSKILHAEAQAALDFHNAKRANVKSPALTWSPELAAVAQTWANHLVEGGKCNLAHTPNNTYGENLFGGSSAEYTAKSASESWYEEIKDFKYGELTPENWYKTGHYTQMVWRGTLRVGMGRASCKDGALVIVAEYDPPGNYMGEKPY